MSRPEEIVKDEVNVMVDTETLGLAPDSVILSIGACLVGRSYESFNKFYQQYTLDQLDRVINPDTLEWWISQDQKIPVGETNLLAGLLNFNEWLTYKCGIDTELVLWCNGTDFDIPLLYNAMKQFGIKPAWKYNAVRDYRTMAKMFPQVPKPEFAGQKHNALDDAINQAKHLEMILDWLANQIDLATRYDNYVNGR